MESLKPHADRTYFLSDNRLKFEVRLWASNRSQTLARTIRGVMYQRSAQVLLTRIEFSSISQEEAEALVDDKFQFLLGHQKHAEMKVDDPRAQGVRSLMEKYPFEMSFVFKAPTDRNSASPSVKAFLDRIDPALLRDGYVQKLEIHFHHMFRCRTVLAHSSITLLRIMIVAHAQIVVSKIFISHLDVH